MIKQVEFRGSSLDDLRAFPKDASAEAGHQLYRVQCGKEPVDWRIVKDIGPGVQEIRIRDRGDAYRVIFIAKLQDAVYVLHCFQKKTQKTSKADLALAKKRYRELMDRQMTEKRYGSVWDAIADTPDEAENMRLRSVLMIYLESEIARRGWTQAEAAVHLGVTQPRVSDLLRGKVSLFGLDSLVKMVAAIGGHIDVKVRTAKRTSRRHKEDAAA